MTILGEPLIANWAISYCFNLSFLRRKRVSLNRSALVAIGSSEYPPPSRRLSGLPAARAEVSDIEGIYRGLGSAVHVLDEHNATRSNVLAFAHSAEMTTCGTIHFATHGDSVLTDTPLESRLMLYSGSVDGLDVSQWDLQGGTVILSACSSGQRAVERRGRAVAADEVLGLQAAFFTAGASCVIGTMWPTDSDVARAIAVAVHRGLVSSVTPDVALQMAVRGYKANPIPNKGRPKDWAPFFLVVSERW
jgi:CHAT domain-containing protein